MSSELLDLAVRVAGRAEEREQVEAFVMRQSDTEVRAYRGEVESLTSAVSLGMGVRVVSRGRQGFAWAGALDEELVAATLREARDNARFATTDEFAGVAEPDGVAYAGLDLHRSELVAFAPERKVDMAIALERATLDSDSRITGLESAEYVDTVYESAVATSTGITSSTRETACYVAAHALAEDAGDVQSGFGYSIGREPGELDVGAAAGDAAERATRLLGATKPATARLTVVLDPYVTAQLLSIIGHTLTGDAVLKGRSLFADRMGDRVGASSLTLVDDATDPEAFSASAVDAEGLATRRTTLLDGGVLTAFLHDSYTGRRSGAGSTGSAVRGGIKGTPSPGAQALRLMPGRRGQAELIADVADGLLVQNVTGLHSGVNPVSGDFSTGAEGLRIRAGELAEPVREITIASTIQRLLLDVEEVGADQEWLPMSAAGVSLVVADVTMSGD